MARPKQASGRLYFGPCQPKGDCLQKSEVWIDAAGPEAVRADDWRRTCVTPLGRIRQAQVKPARRSQFIALTSFTR